MPPNSALARLSSRAGAGACALSAGSPTRWTASTCGHDGEPEGHEAKSRRRAIFLTAAAMSGQGIGLAISALIVGATALVSESRPAWFAVPVAVGVLLSLSSWREGRKRG
jgi:hypothetical protein